MTEILPAGPDDRRFTHRFRHPVEAVTELTTDRRTRRTRIALPLMRALQAAGYTTASWEAVAAAASVTARTSTEQDQAVVIAVIPPPLNPVGVELNPPTGVDVEYVGGPEDGHTETLTPTPGADLRTIALGADRFHRTAYNLGTGRWYYHRARPDTPDTGDTTDTTDTTGGPR